MSQEDRLYNLLVDGKPHRTDEIQLVVYGSTHLGVCRIGGRIDGLKKKGCVIPDARKDEKIKSLYWYQMLKGYPEKVSEKPKISMSSRDQAAKELCKQSFIVGDQTKKVEKQMELFA